MCSTVYVYSSEVECSASGCLVYNDRANTLLGAIGHAETEHFTNTLESSWIEEDTLHIHTLTHSSQYTPPPLPTQLLWRPIWWYFTLRARVYIVDTLSYVLSRRGSANAAPQPLPPGVYRYWRWAVNRKWPTPDKHATWASWETYL